MATSSRSRETTTKPHVSESHERGVSPPVPTLTVVHHVDDAFLMARTALTRGRTTVGRTSALCRPKAFDHALVSRVHAHLEWTGATLSVTDAESRNGTFLNGERVSTTTARPGDVLEIGPVMLLLHMTDAAFSVRSAEHWVGAAAALR